MNLTPQQLQALESGTPVTVVVGRTRCVLLREDVFRDDADYSPATEEELDLLASHAADLIEDDLDEPL